MSAIIAACNMGGEATIKVVSPSEIYVSIDKPEHICITSFSVSKIGPDRAVNVWQVFRNTESKVCIDQFQIGKVPGGFRGVGEPIIMSTGRYEITALGGEYAIRQSFDVNN
ncbi:hypothetical protein [Sphingomonas lacusdianchii]|uniref:hypothetical protein n=1 Tax=Sphingomonas lacusdianchii TaxID=2917992 RepID=UPI001F598F4B|nr:hypothetical protein [Sphingomonas sp. JXJ CY 53]